MLWTVRILGFFLVLITLLPLLSTGKWYVRWWDFPRFQIAALLLIPLVIAILLAMTKTAQWEPRIWTTILLGSLFWQVSHVIPFSPLWSKEIPDADIESPTIKLVVANLDYENVARDPVSQQISEEEADILLLVEYNEGWQEQLRELQSQFPYRHDEVRGEGLGMALWSKLPIGDAETRFLVSERRPSIWAELELEIWPTR